MPVTRPALPSRYATPELIAYGGMGEVYRATDESLGRTVAVKVLSERWAADEEFHARFLREAQTAASLSGEPNVIAIYDVGESRDALPFIVMEYATGGTLADRLREGASRRVRRCGGSSRLPARSTAPTPAASCTATSSPGTCSSRTTARFASPTSASRAPPIRTP